MHRFGEIVLAQVQFVDSLQIKVRPALVLFQELGNIVVAGITSNMHRKGIFLSVKEGAVKDSVIQLNYIFTISEMMVKKTLFSLSEEKKKIVINELNHRLHTG
jgi:mRNA interferase MazF